MTDTDTTIEYLVQYSNNGKSVLITDFNNHQVAVELSLEAATTLANWITAQDLA